MIMPVHSFSAKTEPSANEMRYFGSIDEAVGRSGRALLVDIFLIVVTLFAGVAFFMSWEKLSFIDALYWSTATGTCFFLFLAPHLLSLLPYSLVQREVFPLAGHLHADPEMIMAAQSILPPLPCPYGQYRWLLPFVLRHLQPQSAD